MTGPYPAGRTLLEEILAGKKLSPREVSILNGAAKGESCAETAKRIQIAYETVKTYRKTATAKLAAKNLTHAVSIAICRGILNGQEIDR